MILFWTLILTFIFKHMVCIRWMALSLPRSTSIQNTCQIIIFQSFLYQKKEGRTVINLIYAKYTISKMHIISPIILYFTTFQISHLIIELSSQEILHLETRTIWITNKRTKWAFNLCFACMRNFFIYSVLLSRRPFQNMHICDILWLYRNLLKTHILWYR